MKELAGDRKPCVEDLGRHVNHCVGDRIFLASISLRKREACVLALCSGERTCVEALAPSPLRHVWGVGKPLACETHAISKTAVAERNNAMTLVMGYRNNTVANIRDFVQRAMLVHQRTQLGLSLDLAWIYKLLYVAIDCLHVPSAIIYRKFCKRSVAQT